MMKKFMKEYCEELMKESTQLAKDVKVVDIGYLDRNKFLT